MCEKQRYGYMKNERVVSVELIIFITYIPAVRASKSK